MKINSQTIGSILKEELDKRSHATAIRMNTEDLFDKSKAAQWIKTLIDSKDNYKLENRISGASGERLCHAVSTYLLGMSLRDNLGLNFDFLPRIVSNGSSSDAFHFFWALVCLCHDLGYDYENGSYDLSKMNDTIGRQNLLKIEYDLFDLDEKALVNFGIKKDSEEYIWILNAVMLAKNYDRMRRQTGIQSVKSVPVIDHGIAGALILYDILYKEYERILSMRTPVTTLKSDRNGNHQTAGTLPAVVQESSDVQFITCSLIIACTVARHNMWIAKGTENCKRYESYNLHSLCHGNPNAIVSAKSPLNQMLFLLDFMDTVDPVKGIYTRLAEQKSTKPTKRALNTRRNFLLNKVRIEYIGSYRNDYRWGNTLTYRSFAVSMDLNTSCTNKKVFSDYAHRTAGIDEWLETRSPQLINSSRKCFRVIFYYPTFPRKESGWLGNITDHEVNALLLYEGCGIPGKSGEFYTLANPYQTFNLLMMPGRIGEEVRVCQEHQQPYGHYVREWKKTLEVMTDIFTAQCKYAVYCNEHDKTMSQPLYRVDRKVNFELMVKNNSTFAFTSTSNGKYLKKIAKGKQNPLLLEIKVENDIPYLDYQGFFKEKYVFTDEMEVLLPPFITLKGAPSKLDAAIEKKDFGVDIEKFAVLLAQFDTRPITDDESILIDYLENNCRKAADALDAMRKNGKLLNNENEEVYFKWKERFQTLCRLCMQNIYHTYFDINL